MLALAQPKSADDWYTEGETQYNLGNFDKAADAFKQGFATETVESKKAAYLYNVAQAYRQGGKCKDAAFFYKRYLSLKDEDTAKPLSAEKRSETERFIADMEDCAKKLDENTQKPPSNTLPPDTGSDGEAAGSGSNKVVAQVDTAEGSDDGEEPETPTVIPPPKVLSARFTGGASKISAGSTLNIPIKAVFTLVAGYPVYVQDKLEIDAGIAAAFSPLPYELLGTNEQKTGSLTTLLADAGVTYLVTPRIGVRADAGVGVLILGGISEMNNPFTDMGAPTSGALSMLAVRGAVSGDYAITPNIYATLVPFAFTYSPPKDGLRTDIKSITRMDFMVGVGYRM
jgi:hypothetical protein